jgi:hypothetical protein
MKYRVVASRVDDPPEKVGEFEEESDEKAIKYCEDHYRNVQWYEWDDLQIFRIVQEEKVVPIKLLPKK